MACFIFSVPTAKLVKRKHNCSDHVLKIRNCSHRTWIRFWPNIILFPAGRAEVKLENNERHGNG